MNEPKMVFVVMGNDYPDCVFANDEDAQKYCKSKREATENRRVFNGKAYGTKIYYRTYAFPLIERVSA